MIYDYTLVQWIAACQVRDRLDSLIMRIGQDKSVNDILATAKHPYICKVLKEVVEKQFSKGSRPVIEVILNSVDAGVKSSQPSTIRVKANVNEIVIQDQGESMDLAEILKFLILPFGTEKDQAPSGTYIGQFGIGFFSTLKYCIQNPQKDSVTVRTNKNGQSYEAHFYADGQDASTLRFRLQKKGSRKGIRGTSVTINSHFNLIELRGYVLNEVKSIPSIMSEIYFNDQLLNISGGAWYTSKTIYDDNYGNKFTQQVAIQQIEEPKIVLTSCGVRVKEFSSPARHGIQVLFPGLVKVVIGRDDFVENANYYKAVDALFIALEQMMRSSFQEAEGFLGRQDFIELLPSLLSALRLQELEGISNLDAIMRILLPKKEYVFLGKQYARLERFVDVTAVFTASPQGCAIWGSKYKLYQDFIREKIKIHEVMPVAGLAQSLLSKPARYPNLELAFSYGPMDFCIEQVAFASVPPLTPFMIDEDSKTLYINVEHIFVKEPKNSLKRNLAYAAYLQLPIVKDQFKSAEYIEKEMLKRSNRMIV